VYYNPYPHSIASAAKSRNNFESKKLEIIRFEALESALNIGAIPKS
jgi:hypothetical protein